MGSVKIDSVPASQEETGATERQELCFAGHSVRFGQTVVEGLEKHPFAAILAFSFALAVTLFCSGYRFEA